RRAPVGRRRPALPLPARCVAGRAGRRRGRVPAVQLLARRQPRPPGPAGRGRAVVRGAVRPGQPARAAVGDDRPVERRPHRRLPAGVQPDRRDRQRRQPGPGDGGPGMIERLVLLGATGDLTARYLLPGLAALRQGGHIGDGFRLVGAGRTDGDDDGFRTWAGVQLDRHAPQLPGPARRAVVSACEYHRADVTDPADLRPLVSGAEPVAAYLALPPAVFAPTVSALGAAGPAAGSSIVLEKPFGESLAEAVELNALLAQVVPEDAIFRVDHFLAMTTVQNVLGTRLANRA